MKRGDEFYAPTMGCFLIVSRAAKDGSWVDILVQRSGTGDVWTKRQPLFNGKFSFVVHSVDETGRVSLEEIRGAS